MDPLISIIVPVYNAAEWLSRCIASILNQTYKNLEIILIDDGSQDHSGKICDQYAENDNRIIVVHKENGGAASARNAGLRKCSGEYIGFVDADDWIESDMYEYMLKVLVENQADVAFCSRHDTFEDGSEKNALQKNSFIGECSGEKAFLYCLGGGYSTGVPNKLYKRSLLLETRTKTIFLFDERLKNSEDIVFNVQIIPKAKKAICLDNKFYWRVIRKSNSLQNDMRLTNDRLMEIDAWEQTIHYAEQAELSNQIMKQLTLGYCNFLLAIEIQAYLQKEKKILQLIRKKLKNENLRRNFYTSSNYSFITKAGRLFFEILIYLHLPISLVKFLFEFSKKIIGV